MARQGTLPARFPYTPGYDVVGTVTALGEGVTGLAVGDRVAAYTGTGGYASATTARAALCVPVPDAVPDRRAVLAANMETAVNILWDARPLVGERALVVGAGVVGLLAAALLARVPGLDLLVCDRDPSRAGAAVRVTVVRSPHVYITDIPESAPWGTTLWFDAMVRTDENGNATVAIPRPNDQLGSTYGVHVESHGATADTRVTVPTAQAAIRLIVDRTEQSFGTPLKKLRR